MRKMMQLLKRAGREFLRNLLWIVVTFGPLTAALIYVTNITLVGVLVFGGVFVPVWAAVATVVMVWDGWPRDAARARTAAGRWWEGGGGG